MAFSWKFFNELDKEQVDTLYQSVLHIKENHEKLSSLKSTDMTEAEEDTLQDLIKKYQKSLDHATDILSEFDKELDGLTKAITKKS